MNVQVCEFCGMLGHTVGRCPDAVGVKVVPSACRRRRFDPTRGNVAAVVEDWHVTGPAITPGNSRRAFDPDGEEGVES